MSMDLYVTVPMWRKEDNFLSTMWILRIKLRL